MMSQAPRKRFSLSPHGALALLLGILLLVAGCGEDEPENTQTPGAGAGPETVEVIPGWVNTEPESNDHFDRFVVHGGWWASDEEARSEYQGLLKRSIHSQLDGYLDESAGHAGVQTARDTSEDDRSVYQQELLKKHPQVAHELVHYDPEQFQERVHISQPYKETREFKVAGLMYQLHSLVEIETGLKEELGHRWTSYESRHRVGQLGLGWLAIVGIIVVLYFHLRMGQADIPRRRKFLLSMGLAVVLLFLFPLLAQWVRWI